jgi:hypothetical protein
VKEKLGESQSRTFFIASLVMSKFLFGVNFLLTSQLGITKKYCCSFLLAFLLPFYCFSSQHGLLFVRIGYQDKTR